MNGETAPEVGRGSKPSKDWRVHGHHLDRSAVVYVRQSTRQQVVRHQESTRLQYDFVKRAVDLGWSPQQVLVIDDDLGVSATSVEGRPGFQRLVADVSLGRVGIVLGMEAGRLARSCRDWYQLMEICAAFGVLIADADGLYDPASYNDRLLLGLKGAISEAEIHIMRQRMLQGKRAKARRGELGMSLPMGYVWLPTGGISKDPDEQAQASVERLFALFATHGTINATLQNLVQDGVQMPVRARSGLCKGELEWHRPNRITIGNVLHHPIYAGAYVYGRRATDPRRKKPGRPATGRTVVPPEKCEVLIRDRVPAYITWEQFERNQAQLRDNASRFVGTPRHGPSLLSGLIYCGRCGIRMASRYTDNGKGLRYACIQALVSYGDRACQSVQGRCVDEHVTALVFKALEPAALELSMKMSERIESERQERMRHWRHRLERTRFDAERAHRQYNTVEPENRLVARTLEKKWEAALAEAERLEAEYERFRTQQPAVLSQQERASIRKLASDIPILWNAKTTTPADRQAIVRQLVRRVTITVQGNTEIVSVEIQWSGGDRTVTSLVRPVACLNQLSNHADILKRVKDLRKRGLKPAKIAERLNDEAWRPPKRRRTFNAPMVADLLHRQGIRLGTRRTRSDMVVRRRGEWTLQELANKLKMPTITLYSWLRRSIVSGRRSANGIWLIRASKNEIEKLRARRRQQRTHD